MQSLSCRKLGFLHYERSSAVYFARYNATCLSRSFLGPHFVFDIDRCSIHTVKINKDSPHWDFYLKFGIYRIPVYSGFDLDRFNCILFLNLFQSKLQLQCYSLYVKQQSIDLLQSRQCFDTTMVIIYIYNSFFGIRDCGNPLTTYLFSCSKNYCIV